MTTKPARSVIVAELCSMVFSESSFEEAIGSSEF